MRATTLLRIVLSIYHVFVRSLELREDGLVAWVAPQWRVPRCSNCGTKCTRVHSKRAREWRHLDCCGWKVILKYVIRRIKCRKCRKVTTEKVPWADHDSGFTRAFEERCAFYAKHASQTTVSQALRVTWRTVGRIVNSFVSRTLGPSSARLDGLRHIGIDELSYRKHHEYITTVVDHERGVVVWTGRGKSAETLRAFFAALGPKRSAMIESVTIDMSAAYIKAVTECVPNALMIFDRFHVQRLVQDAVDATRRDEVRKAGTKAEKKELKGTRFVLLKGQWNLSSADHQTLQQVKETNEPLYTAYLLKELFAGILDGDQVTFARMRLTEWCSDARASELEHFVKVADTIEKRMDGIVEYVRTRYTNARTEGLNGKIRTITRRAFGFHDASSLMAMIHLCCGGVTVSPAFSAPPMPSLK
jgi:transposase